MAKRLLSAGVGIAIALFILISERFVSISIAAIILLALYEIYLPFGFIKRLPLAIMGFSLGGLMVFGLVNHLEFMIPALCCYVMLMFLMAILYQKVIKFADIAILFFSTIYIALTLSHMWLLYDSQYGRFYIYLIFFGAWLPDSGAFFMGKYLGRHPLAPTISPKKTVEGVFGGYLAGMISFLLYGFVVSGYFGLKVNFWSLLLLSAICATAALIGDLAASLIKRELGIKDYGSIMPGHGGLLDRFDSVIFVAPVVYYYLKFLPVIIK